MPKISPHAIVEKGAELAEGVRVGSFSYIGPKVRIGPGCIIENNVTIVGQTSLGERNHVFPMAAIGMPPDGAADGGASVTGDANSFREHVTVYAGIERPTQVGTDNLFMIDCAVGAGAVVGDHSIFANLTHVGPGAHVADYAQTSGFAALEGGVTVGADTFIAGYAGLDRDVPRAAAGGRARGGLTLHRGLRRPRPRRAALRRGPGQPVPRPRGQHAQAEALRVR